LRADRAGSTVSDVLATNVSAENSRKLEERGLFSRDCGSFFLPERGGKLKGAEEKEGGEEQRDQRKETFALSAQLFTQFSIAATRHQFRPRRASATRAFTARRGSPHARELIPLPAARSAVIGDDSRHERTVNERGLGICIRRAARERYARARRISNCRIERRS